MVIARRLYVYFIAGVSLAMTSIGLANLLALAMSRVADALGASVIQDSPDEVRRTLSLYAAFVIVAFPVWLLHWWLAERAADRPGTEGQRERESAIRALYLSLGLALPLLFLIGGSIETLMRLLNRVFGDSALPGIDRQFWTNVATVLVAAAIMIYHWRIRRQDEASGSFEGPSSWLPRLYLYLAAFVGAMFLLIGLGDIIRTVDDVLFGTRNIFMVDRWWADPLSSAIARTLVGLALWSFHWEWSLRSLRQPDWVGASERRSSLRWLYVYLIVFVSVLFTLQGVSSSLDSVFRWVLGAGRDNLLIGWPRAIVEPIVVALPFAAFWAYHRLIVVAAAEPGESTPQMAAVRRLYTYLVAIIGLTFTAVGASWVLGTLIDLLLGGTRTISVSSLQWRADVAQFSALALVGAGAWLWQWNQAEQLVARADEVERDTTIRRVYLYLTLAATLVAMLVSLAIVIYRVIADILGVTSGTNLASSLSLPLGIVIIAAVLFVYHLGVLRGDLAARAPEEAGVTTVRVPLTLVAPVDGDVEAALGELRAHLPEGYVLEAGRVRKANPVLPPAGERLERDHA